MKTCPQCGKQLEDEANFCSNCGARQEPKAEVPPPDLSNLRARLNRLDDPQIDALALDHFPAVQNRFGRGLRKDEKVNLILEHCRHNPDAVPILENWLKRQPATCDPQDARACYLTHVIEENSRLQLQGIRSASGLVSIDLEEVYVTLTATVRRTVRDAEAWVEEMAKLAPGERPDTRPVRFSKPDRSVVETVKVQVQEALAMHPRLVVLGDPGSGKTTLLRYLALTFARDFNVTTVAQADSLRYVKQRLGLDERRLPILLPLRDFARYLEKECPDVGADGPRLLLDYLRLYFTNQDLVLPADFFATYLKAGQCAVLFDGVDEVARMPTRQRIARILEKFTLAYPKNRYVVTSRIVGYTGGARLGADYATTTVRDFTDDDIARFARHWNRAVEVVLAGGATEHALRKAETEANKLISAIEGNARVRELAVNPLLLTVIALVQRYRAQLPDRRVELYEEAIEVLLVQWDAVKGLPATEVLQGLELDAGDRRSLLEPVALWLMEQHAREIELDDLRKQLAQPFQGMLKDWRLTEKAVNGFIALINERSGLLTERGQGIYAFSHLTFQEHLAARAIADRADNVAYTLARLGDSWWREVVLLEAGYLSTQGKRRATELIRAIMEHKPEPEPYHNLVLAAEAVRDVGQARTEGDLAGEIQARLRKAFETPLKKGADLKTLVQRRAAAAEALGKIESGSYGAQPAFWTLPYGEPVWVEIPAGEFWMGGEAYDDEKPVHKVTLKRYWIAKAPITNAQYRLFVEATGQRAPRHWENGAVPRGLESHPVVNVTWHEALAYCRWLTEKMQEAGGKIRVWRDGGVDEVFLSPASCIFPARLNGRRRHGAQQISASIRGAIPGRKAIAIQVSWAWRVQHRWASSRRAPRRMGAWIWWATCGNGHGASTRNILTGPRRNERTWKPGTISPVCCGVAPSTAIETTPAAPIAAGTTRATGTGTSVFGWWSPHRAKRPLCDLALWPLYLWDDLDERECLPNA